MSDFLDCTNKKTKDLCDTNGNFKTTRGICETIEQTFRNVFDDYTKTTLSDAEKTELQKANDLYTKLITKPGENEERGWCELCQKFPTIHDACRTPSYKIYEENKDDFIRHVSDCELIFSNIPTNLKMDEWKGTLIDKVYDQYTSRDNCMFPDQDYGTDAKSAKDVCLRQAELTSKHREKMKDKENNFWAVWRGAGSQSKSDNIMNTHLALSMKPKSLIDQINNCRNKFTVSVINEISVDCPRLSDEAIKMMLDAGYSLKEIDNFNTTTISNVEQTNTSESIQNCEMSSFMNSLLTMDATIDNQAIQEAISSSEGLGASATSANDMCTHINVELSPCKYISQTNCCNNTSNKSMLNTLTAGCNTEIDDIVQRNISKNLQNCKISTQTELSEDMKAAVFNVAGQKATSKAVGLTGLAIIGIIIVILIIAGVFMYYFANRIKLILGIVGAIAILGGIGSIVYVVRSFKKSESIINNPYSACNGSEIKLSQKMTFGEAKDRFKLEKDVMGFDFFPDNTVAGENEGDEPRKITDVDGIPDDWVGLAVFMFSVGRGDSCEVSCTVPVNDLADCPADKITKSATFTKTNLKLNYLIGGVIAFIIGIALALGPFIWDYIFSSSEGSDNWGGDYNSQYRRPDYESMNTGVRRSTSPEFESMNTGVRRSTSPVFESMNTGVRQSTSPEFESMNTGVRRPTSPVFESMNTGVPDEVTQDLRLSR
jgi:hypothetical protein